MAHLDSFYILNSSRSISRKNLSGRKGQKRSLRVFEFPRQFDEKNNVTLLHEKVGRQKILLRRTNLLLIFCEQKELKR